MSWESHKYATILKKLVFYAGEEATVEPLSRHNDGAKYQDIQAVFPNSESADKAVTDVKDALPSFQNIQSVQWVNVWTTHSYWLFA